MRGPRPPARHLPPRRLPASGRQLSGLRLSNRRLSAPLPPNRRLPALPPPTRCTLARASKTPRRRKQSGDQQRANEPHSPRPGLQHRALLPEVNARMPPADPRVPTRRGSISPDQVTTPTNHSTYERIIPTTTSDPQPPTPNPPHSPTTPAPSARDQANPPAPTDQPHNPTQPKAPHTAERRRSRRGSGGQGRPRQPAAPPGPAAQAGEIRTGRNKVQRRQTARQANRGQRHVPRGASTGGGGTRGGTSGAARRWPCGGRGAVGLTGRGGYPYATVAGGAAATAGGSAHGRSVLSRASRC